MGVKYQVKVNGKTEWKHETAEYEGTQVFPPEYLGRPDSGTVELLVNGEVIGVQTSQADEDKTVAAARKAAARGPGGGDGSR